MQLEVREVGVVLRDSCQVSLRQHQAVAHQLQAAQRGAGRQGGWKALPRGCGSAPAPPGLAHTGGGQSAQDGRATTAAAVELGIHLLPT